MRTEGGRRRRKNMSRKLWPMGTSQHPHPHWVPWNSFRREMLLPHSTDGETEIQRGQPVGVHHRRATCLGSEPVNSSLDTPHQAGSSNRCVTPLPQSLQPWGSQATCKLRWWWPKVSDAGSPCLTPALGPGGLAPAGAPGALLQAEAEQWKPQAPQHWPKPERLRSSHAISGTWLVRAHRAAQAGPGASCP